MLHVGSDTSTGDPILVVIGDLDLAGAPAFRAQVAEILRDRPERLRIDLSGSSFIDSVGVGLLLGVVRRCAGEVQLRVSPEVARCLRAYGVDSLMDRVDA